MTIHIVEDNPDMLDSLRMLLKLRGFEVRSYLRALDLLDALQDIEPDDVVISDYYLPDMNGVELLKRVRSQRPPVRVMLLTGSREDGVSDAARGLRNCKVLYKPLDLDMLESHITRRKAT